MSTQPEPQADVQAVYRRLGAAGFSTPNSAWLACMVASWCCGKGVLPDCLGLEPQPFHALTARLFPNVALPSRAPSGSRLDYGRMLEREDLVGLLRQYAVATDCEPIIALLVAGCLGSDHLWQDLGLWSRGS
jgi:nitrogen fixation protein NifQ